MNVTSTTNSLYSQYQNLIDRFKSGEIDYREALSEHQEFAPQTRDLIGTGVLTGSLEGGPVQINMSLKIEQQIRNHLADQSGTTLADYQQAAKAYETGMTSWTSGKIIIPMAPSSIADIAPKLDPAFMSDVRREFNAAAFDYLSSYANDNKAEWMTTAKEIGVSAEGGMFLPHFFRLPSDSGIDVSMGVPNSQAEQIFRQIASATEIAQFESEMSATQQTMQSRVEQRTLRVMEGTNIALEAFAPQRAALESAGLTAEDMAGVMLHRDVNGAYIVTSPTDKADIIETAINTNPELRAFYDQAWAQSS